MIKKILGGVIFLSSFGLLIFLLSIEFAFWGAILCLLGCLFGFFLFTFDEGELYDQ